LQGTGADASMRIKNTDDGKVLAAARRKRNDFKRAVNELLYGIAGSEAVMKLAQTISFVLFVKCRNSQHAGGTCGNKRRGAPSAGVSWQVARQDLPFIPSPHATDDCQVWQARIAVLWP